MNNVSTRTIQQAIGAIRNRHGMGYGSAGNCAVFAVALNEVFEGEDTYITVDSGEHYQFVDHVLWKRGGACFDLAGAWSLESLKDYWSDSENDSEVEIEEVFDDGSGIRRLVDEGNGLLAPATSLEECVALLREAAWGNQEALPAAFPEARELTQPLEPFCIRKNDPFDVQQIRQGYPVRVEEGKPLLCFGDVDDHVDGNGWTILALVAGSGTLYQSEKAIPLTPGQTVVFDDRFPHRFESEPIDQVCFAITAPLGGLCPPPEEAIRQLRLACERAYPSAFSVARPGPSSKPKMG